MRVFVLIAAFVIGVVHLADAAETTDHFNPLSATYEISHRKITLVGGKAVSKPIEPGAATTTTKIIGTPASGDLNSDEQTDAAVMLTQDLGGSGTFYYIAAAVNLKGRAQGTNAILLGDRIVPRTVKIISGQIIVTYLDRKNGEPFSTKPTVPVTKRFVLEGKALKEAAP
jgi:hypothetical protein